MSSLKPVSALDAIAIPGRTGKADGEAGVIVSEREDLGLASVAVRKGREEALVSTVRTAYGVALPDGPVAAEGEAVTFIGAGPGQWFAVSRTLKNEALAAALDAALKGLASVADQSSGRAVLRLEGPRAQDVLAKGLAVDLQVFPEGAAATGTIAHMGVLVWRTSDGYEIALFRSLAGSFWRWLEAAAAAFGLDVVTAS